VTANGDAGELVRLRDGSEVLLRPIRPSDKTLLKAGFEQLSPESRYRRFFSPITKLSDKMLVYLTEVDHHDHEALVAVQPKCSAPVGVARYVRLPEDPHVAEVAVTVVDPWQGRGVATELVNRLVERAQEAGIEQFAATCIATNRDVIDLLQRVGASTTEHLDEGLVELTIDLPRPGDEKHPMHDTLRHAAAGDIEFRTGSHDVVKAEDLQDR
jgi:RimJ/RimL family protein N-acetyltransferase